MRMHVAVGTGSVLASLLMIGGPARAVDPPEADARPLAERLAKHPVTRQGQGPAAGPGGASRYRLFMMDIAGGAVTPVADEPAPGSTSCGSPFWSADGRRILFDSFPHHDFTRAHIWSIDLADAPATARDLGPGNCPTAAADGRRIAFLSTAGGRTGVHAMNADGTGRVDLGAFGRPAFSPDGRRVLVSDLAIPCTVGLLDVGTGKARLVRLPGKKFGLRPQWAGAGTIVALIGDETPDTIALVDVSRPDKIELDPKKADGEPVEIDPDDPEGAATVKEVLWRRGDGPDVTPTCPVYHPGSRRYVFVGVEPRGHALYSGVAGTPAPAKRLEPEGFDTYIEDIALSPDGRYVLFNSGRIDPERRAR